MSGTGAAAEARVGFRSPLEYLLHALNQPLTGLQCSMEVALAVELTPRQYTNILRQGLELTERMRWLVEALREVAELQADAAAGGKKGEALIAVDMKAMMCELIEEMRPVAEAAEVAIALESESLAEGAKVGASGPRLRAMLLRTLDAAVALGGPGGELGVKLWASGGTVGLLMNWRGEQRAEADSRAEVGLVVAQAGLDREGASWERSRSGAEEVLRVSFAPRMETERQLCERDRNPQEILRERQAAE